jgi:membrane dipeptidase
VLGLGTASADTPPLPAIGPQLTDLGLTLSASEREAGERFLAAHATVDLHCHPGRFFQSDLPFETPTTRAFGPPFIERAVDDLHAGRVTAALFAGVSDMRLLEASAQGIRAARDFGPGEAYADYRRQVATLRKVTTRRYAARGLSVPDIDSAFRRHETAIVFSIEGGDFIEQRLDRVHEAHRDGVRAITLVHYHVNQIGDIQTEPEVHSGLTPFGRDVVREMNATGILVDLAHATHAVTRDAVAVSSRPMMISHTNLASSEAHHPRLVSLEHAKLVSEAGGLIGSWPSGIGQTTFAGYVDSIARLVDAVGIDHVGIGTDMDANYRPVFTSYRDWSLIPAALLARGLATSDVAQIMGGNFLRVLGAVQAR